MQKAMYLIGWELTFKLCGLFRKDENQKTLEYTTEPRTFS